MEEANLVCIPRDPTLWWLPVRTGTGEHSEEPIVADAPTVYWNLLTARDQDSEEAS